MLAKLTVPVVAEVREVTAMVGAARSVRKEEWESDSGATFHMSHTRAGMSAYKKASPGTNVEIADGNILPVDGFGRIEVDLDQPGRTTKMVKMDDVAYVPGLSRNLLSTVKEAAIEASLTENGLVKIASGAALRASASRGVMEVHRMLAHPSEDITRKTAVMMGIETTGQWGACETCFQVKAKRHAVPKKTDERASVRGQRFFVDVGRPMKHSSLGGNSYVVIFVDDCTRFKVVRFVKKRDTTATLLSLIADYITPQKLSIKCIRTDNGGEFEGEFQRKLDRRSITHEHTPPDTPQYNGVAERALGLLREKAIILVEELDDVINVPREKLWAQAMLFACDVTNKSVTTSTDRGKSPYELWFGNFPTANHLRPFGAVGYARQSAREHKMAPKGEKCVFIGTPQLNVQELGQEQQLALHEHETQEALSELEGVTQGALSEHEEETQEALSENEREQHHEEGGAEPALGSANLEGPALPALRKLTIDGNIPPLLSSRTRSRRPHTGVEGEALHYIPEPRNRRQAMESQSWDEWRKAEETEMLEMVEDWVYKQVARPKDKLVVGTKILYKRKIGQDGKVEKYKCRLVAQGFWQVEGVHYTEKYSPTPATASIRMLLAMAAAKDGELRHFDAEHAFLKAVGRLNKAIYGLVQAGRCWNNKLCDDMTAIGFEQAKADPCVFREVVDGETEMVVVVHVDDILAHAKDKATMDRFAAELGQKFKLKDMGDAG
ncbi:unnamed protein product [Ascophyllum nodosum]